MSHLLQFKAGKLQRDGTRVVPQAAKGMVTVWMDDGLLSFQWRDRDTGSADPALILFAEDATWKRVPACTTGRVFMLDFKDAKKHFFWMQDAKTDRDEEIEIKLNYFIAHPPDDEMPVDSPAVTTAPAAASISTTAPTPAATAAAAAPATPATPATATAARATPATPAAPARPTSSGAPPAVAATPVTSAAAGASAAALDQRTLQSFLQGLGAAARAKELDLQQVITTEALLRIIQDPAAAARLLPFMPEELRTEAELAEVVHSPQLQQTVESLNTALQSSQLPSILRQCGVDPALMGTVGGGGSAGAVEVFLKALAAQVAKEQASGGAGSSASTSASSSSSGSGGGSDKPSS